MAMKPKTLYHFTNTVNLYQIFQEGKLALRPSNVLPAEDTKLVKKKVQIGNKTVETVTVASEKSDSYHPVVWLTSNLAAADAVGNARNPEKKFDKSHYRIGFKFSDDYIKWSQWEYYAEMERDNPKWLADMKRNAKDWRNFYICEHEVPVSEIVEIYDAFAHKYLDISKGIDCLDLSDV